MQRRLRQVIFRPTGDARFPWEAEVEGERWRVRINEFPEEPSLYSLFVDGAVTDELLDWPSAWTRPAEAVESDADAFLERMRQASGALGPARARELACVIARRHLGSLGEDASLPRAMVEEAHALAATGPIPQARFEAWLETLREVSANVDPDRLGAPDVWRELGVVRLALQACTEGPPAGAGPFDVVCGALAVRALRSPPANEAERQSVREALRASWGWKAVQEEARWLAAQVEERTAGRR